MFVNPDTGKEMDFTEVVFAILVEEQGYSAADAKRLIKTHPRVMINGAMGGHQTYRATALALEIVEADEANKEDNQ